MYPKHHNRRGYDDICQMGNKNGAWLERSSDFPPGNGVSDYSNDGEQDKLMAGSLAFFYIHRVIHSKINFTRMIAATLHSYKI